MHASLTCKSAHGPKAVSRVNCICTAMWWHLTFSLSKLSQCVWTLFQFWYYKIFTVYHETYILYHLLLYLETLWCIVVILRGPRTRVCTFFLGIMMEKGHHFWVLCCPLQLVAGSAIQAFEEVCPERIDLIHKNYRKLCNLLVDVEEWGQVVIINMLTRYCRTQFANPNAVVR